MSETRDTSEPIWQQLRHQMEELKAVSTRRLDPAALNQRLEQRAKALRGRPERSHSETRTLTLLAFSQGTHQYGVPIADVIEVQKLGPSTPVPGAPTFIPGVIQWRGLILSLLDLGQLFDVPETGLSDLHACVIVEAAGCRIGIVAREIQEIIHVPLDELHPAPQLPGQIRPEWVAGVYGETRLILQMGALLEDVKTTD